MKVTFDRQSLAAGIALVHNVVSTNTTMPILAHMLIEASGERAILSGTDMESFGRVELKATVEEAGQVTAPAKLLADIMRALPEGEVTLQTSGTRLTLLCQRSKYELTTMPTNDFPDFPKVEPETTVVLRQADLKRILKNTMFAIPTRDPRKVLMGVLFDFADGRLTCVATDGRKLGKAVVEPSESRGAAKAQAIIPQTILNEINHAIGEEGEISIGIADRQIMFSLNNATYVANRIEGTYPKYEAVIPQSFKRTIKIQKNNLADAINRAAPVAERKHHSILLKFNPGQIQIAAQSFEDGSYEDEIEVDFDGEPFKIAFNHQYLQEIFKVITDPVIDMKIKENNAPVVFECESDPDALFLVMPVRMADLENAEAGADAGQDE